MTTRVTIVTSRSTTVQFEAKGPRAVSGLESLTDIAISRDGDCVVELDLGTHAGRVERTALGPFVFLPKIIECLEQAHRGFVVKPFALVAYFVQSLQV